MAITKKELIKFVDEPVELASEENKSREILVKEKFINDFERSYEYEKEVQTEITELSPYYIAAMPDLIQEEIKAKVIAALTECGECTPENVERAMSSKIYDLDDLIDIKEYVRRIEEEQRKKTEQKRGNGR
jgi:phosphoribosylaminoimidazole (AIR) synthetase